MVRKARRSTQQESADDLPPSPFLLDSLVRRAKERRLSEASEKERERRLSSLNPRERRASLDHETRLIRERERKSIVEALERRRVSLATEPLDNKRQLKKLRRKSRRRSSNGSGKRRRSFYRKRGRRSIARDIQPRRHSDDHEGRRQSLDEKKRRNSDDDREPRKSLADEQIRNNSIGIANKAPISPVKLKTDSLDDIGTNDEYSSSYSGSGVSGSSSTPSRNKPSGSGLLAVKSPVVRPRDQDSSNERNKAVVTSPPQRLPVHVPGALTKLSIAARPRLRGRDITDYTRKKSIHDRFAPSLVQHYDLELELAKEKKKQDAEEKKIETERFLKARLMKRRGNPSALTAVIPQMISPGLKILNAIENIFMQHKAFKKEGCNAGVINMYQFVNGDGRNIIRVEEQSKIKGFLGLGQIIKYTCYDEENSEVGQIYRNDIVGCGKVKKRVKVYCPSNHLIGYVEQKRGCIEPQIDVTDHEGFVYAVIRLDTSEFGPIRAWMCRRHKIFSIKTLRGAARGQIREDWDEQPLTPIGVHLSDEMNIVAKTLLMTATIIVYDQFCKKRTESLQKDPQQIVEISDKDDDEDDEDEN